MARTPSGSGSSAIPGADPKIPPSPGTPTKPSAQPSSSWRQNPSAASTSSLAASASPFIPKGPVPPSSPLRTPSRKPSGPSPLAPGMGPTFTPTKQAATKSSNPIVRSVSGGKAWTATAPEPAPQLTGPTALSFAEIQQSQQQRSAPVKDRRSLKEIQEEEESIQREADFMRWWEEEEARFQIEMAAVQAASQKGSTPGGRSAGRGSHRGKGKERVAEAGRGQPKQVGDGPSSSRPSNNSARAPQEGQSSRQRQPGKEGKQERRRPHKPPPPPPGSEAPLPQ